MVPLGDTPFRRPRRINFHTLRETSRLCNASADDAGSDPTDLTSTKMLTTRLIYGALLVPLFYVLDQYIHTQYIFDPVKLQQISQNAIETYGNDTLPMLRQITADLKAEYGDAIIADWTKDDWFWNNAGGCMVWSPIHKT